MSSFNLTAEEKPRAERLRCNDPIYCSARTRPMKLLVLGLPRTGTYSLFLACRCLGLRPYHFASVWSQRHMAPWVAALKAKYLGLGNPWVQSDFDTLLGDSDCTMDVPCALFVDELLAAYPDAKVVLTNRDVDAWYVSMSNTLFRVFRWRSWLVLSYLDPGFAGVYFEHVRVSWMGFCNWDFGPGMKERYRAHYEHVRAVVDKERLLEYRVQEGWGPLCAFLGVDVPDGEEFPNVNDGKQFDVHHDLMWRKSVRRSTRNVLWCGGLFGVPIAGIVYWWRSR